MNEYKIVVRRELVSKLLFDKLLSRIDTLLEVTYPKKNDGPNLTVFDCIPKLELASPSLFMLPSKMILELYAQNAGIKPDITMFRYSLNSFSQVRRKWEEFYHCIRENKNEKPWAGTVLFSGILILKNSLATQNFEDVSTEQFLQTAEPNSCLLAEGQLIDKFDTILISDSDGSECLFFYFQAIQVEHNS